MLGCQVRKFCVRKFVAESASISTPVRIAWNVTCVPDIIALKVDTKEGCSYITDEFLNKKDKRAWTISFILMITIPSTPGE